MDVKMGFWEIMNLHILIEKCMLRLSTERKKKKLHNSSSELQNVCDLIVCVCVCVFEGDILCDL